MTECHYLAIDVAKNVFQLHGAAVDGRLVFRRRLMRDQLSAFVVQLPPAILPWKRAPAPIIGLDSSPPWGTESG